MQFSLGHHWRPFFCSCSNSGINLRAKLMDLNCSQEGRQKISVYQQGHGLQSRRNPAVQVDLLLHKIFLMDSSDLIIVVGFSASSKGFSVLFFHHHHHHHHHHQSSSHMECNFAPAVDLIMHIRVLWHGGALTFFGGNRGSIFPS
jgi:hypothetical protein